MKLEIDLGSTEDIESALPLLQAMLDGVPRRSCKGDPQRHASDAGLDISKTIADPAAVFGGGMQPAVPLPPAGAPSIAGAVPLPTAPEVTTAITSTATPTAPVPPVPSVPPSAMPAVPHMANPATAVDLDKNGLPWDERIHAGSKAKIKDGSWRMKKEVAPELVASVEAELCARMGNVSAPATPIAHFAAVPGLAPQVTAPLASAGASPTPESAVAPWPFPAPEVPPATVASPDPATFEQLMPRVTAAVTAGLLAPMAVNAACGAHGLASVVALQQSPQYVPLVWATLKQQNPALQ